MHIILGITIVLIIIWGIYRIGHQEDDARKKPVLKTQPKEDCEILDLCDGNEDKVKCLIEYEMEIRPKISRKQAIKNALYRLKNDRK